MSLSREAGDGELMFSPRRELQKLAQVGMATGRGGDEFRYPILISASKIYPHPHTQTQRVSNFCLIPIG